MSDELQPLFEQLLGNDPVALESIIVRNGEAVSIPFKSENYPFGADEIADFIGKEMGFDWSPAIEDDHFVMTNAQFEKIKKYWELRLPMEAQSPVPSVEELLDTPEVALSEPDDFWDRLVTEVEGLAQEARPKTITTDVTCVNPDKDKDRPRD